MSLYTDAKAAGLEMDSYESDLYLKDTPEARELIKKHKVATDAPFISQIDGAHWLDIPFMFDPWWRRLIESVPIFEGSDPRQE